MSGSQVNAGICAPPKECTLGELHTSVMVGQQQ